MTVMMMVAPIGFVPREQWRRAELEAWMSTKNKRTAGGDERSDAEAEDGEQSDDCNSTATRPTPRGIC